MTRALTCSGASARPRLDSERSRNVSTSIVSGRAPPGSGRVSVFCASSASVCSRKTTSLRPMEFVSVRSSPATRMVSARVPSELVTVRRSTPSRAKLLLSPTASPAPKLTSAPVSAAVSSTRPAAAASPRSSTTPVLKKTCVAPSTIRRPPLRSTRSSPNSTWPPVRMTTSPSTITRSMKTTSIAPSTTSPSSAPTALTSTCTPRPAPDRSPSAERATRSMSPAS